MSRDVYTERVRGGGVVSEILFIPDCPPCQGRGTVDTGTCPDCGGTGLALANLADGGDDDTESIVFDRRLREDW
jgi:RecJ-like exonuclease